MSSKKEKHLPSLYPCSISDKCLEKIHKQMENYICSIIKRGTGFFCEIPFPDRKNILEVLITNNHVIDKEFLDNNSFIEVKIKNDKKTLKINLKDKITFTNQEYDTTIIEIDKKRDKIKKFLKLDEKIIDDIVKNENQNNDFVEQTIYIIHYPCSKLSLSIGIIKNINCSKKNNFYHCCHTNNGSSGSPIFTLNNKIFGIHKGIHRDNNFGEGVFLNYPIKKFISEIKLKKLNTKYKLNIRNTDVEKIFLHNQKNDDLKVLGKIQFDKLKELTFQDCNKNIIYPLIKYNLEKLEKIDLRNNGPLDIEISKYVIFKELKTLKLNLIYNDIIYILEKVNLKNLKILDLSLNKISDINILTKVNYPELKELILKENNIVNIKLIEFIKFEKLELLNLGLNSISDIDVLEKVNFKNLKKLNLEKNIISNIGVLEKVKFPELEILDLSYNKISDINILKKVNFKNLKELYLNDNKEISDIKVLKDVNFVNLKKLNLGANKISDINILRKVEFKNLEHLFLCANKISDINVLENVKFPELKILSFGVNNITNIEVIEKVKFEKIEILGFSKNKISDINVFSKTNFKNLYKLTFDDNNLDKKKNESIITHLRKKIERFYPFGFEGVNYYIDGTLN